MGKKNYLISMGIVQSFMKKCRIESECMYDGFAYKTDESFKPIHDKLTSDFELGHQDLKKIHRIISQKRRG